MRAVLTEYSAKNSLGDARGTLAALSQTFQHVMGTLRPLLDDGGILTSAGLQRLIKLAETAHEAVSPEAAANEKRLQAQLASASASLASAQAECARLTAALKAEEQKRKESEAAVSELTNKHIALATAKVESEEKLKSFSAEREALKKKVEELSVFESGLAQMRKMWETESEARTKLEDDFQALLQLQNKFKFTWLPDKAVKNCMKCKNAFGMFRGKNHCRYCGR
jgi:chromosome segregation ATPase